MKIDYDFNTKKEDAPLEISNHRVVRCCGNCRHFFRFSVRNGYCMYPELRKSIKKGQALQAELELAYKKTHEHMLCDQYAILRSRFFIKKISDWIKRKILKNGYVETDEI